MKKTLFTLFLFSFLLICCSHKVSYYSIDSYSIEYICVKEEKTIDITMPFSDFIVTSNKIIIFTPEINKNKGKILLYEKNNNSYICTNKVEHIFGHCNSVDYNQNLDLVMISSGGASNAIENKGFYLIKYDNYNTNWNKYQFISLKNINTIGKQVNAYFLNNNEEENTIDILVLSNKNEKRLFTTIRLNIKTFTFEIIECTESFYTIETCNQGGIIFNNYLFQGSGHDGIFLNISGHNNFNNIKGYKINYRKYKGYISEGVYIKDNIIYCGLLCPNSTARIVCFNYKHFFNALK